MPVRSISTYRVVRESLKDDRPEESIAVGKAEWSSDQWRMSMGLTHPGDWEGVRAFASGDAALSFGRKGWGTRTAV